MPLFRRRRRDAPPSPPARMRQGPPRAAPRGEEADWRSYDAVAEAYARALAPRTALPVADLVQMLEIRPGARVLDVGTGTGVAARAALASAGEGGLVVGVDPSVPMLGVAHREAGPVRYAAGEAIDLPFRAESFDAVVCAFALSHFAKEIG